MNRKQQILQLADTSEIIRAKKCIFMLLDIKNLLYFELMTKIGFQNVFIKNF
jgi:hypothetical protein